MGEKGLKAFDEITLNIADQDEKIWRQSSAKKCLKKEIEAIKEQCENYEVQIATLQKDPLYDRYEEFNKLLADNMKEHIQMHKLLSLAISSKSVEVEKQEKDLDSWDKKYAQTISDLKSAYELKKKFIETTNPTFKKMLEVDAAHKVAEVRLKQLKASSERRRKSKEQLEKIREKIFHTTILNFVIAVKRKWNYENMNSKLEDLKDKKKNMVRDMFEAQEALKKLRVHHTPRVRTFQTPSMMNMNDKKRAIEITPDKVKRVHVDPQNSLWDKKETKDLVKRDESTKDRIIPPPPRKQLPSKKLNIISNQILPPLKTILSKQRSRLDLSLNRSMESSFNRTQSSQVNSQSDSMKNPKTTPKQSQEEVDSYKTPIIKETTTQIKNMEPPPTKPVNVNKPSDFLNNLKFTSQSNKFQIPKFSNPICKQTSQMNQTQTNSILKNQGDKRKPNESFQESDLDSSMRKKEKNVNFASPIQQLIDIQSTSSNEAHLDFSSPMNSSINKNMNCMYDDQIQTTYENDGDFDMTNQQFSFGPRDKSNDIDTNITPISIFGGKNETQSSFGFSFGGPSKTDEVWDIFG